MEQQPPTGIYSRPSLYGKLQITLDETALRFIVKHLYNTCEFFRWEFDNFVKNNYQNITLSNMTDVIERMHREQFEQVLNLLS